MKARSQRGWIPALIFLVVVLAACGAGTGDDEDYGIEGPFDVGEPLGKADSAGVPGPRVNNDTRATQVWDATNKWEDTDTEAARRAGMAWPADSGLSWDDKYAAWIASMERTASNGAWYETFTLTTPWGKSLPAPKLECAELAIFLRVSFAAWYGLPFYLTAVDGSGTRVYFGHFGARTKWSRYKNTPNYGYAYADYSDTSAEQLDADGWPQDATLRGRGLYGGGDDMDWLTPGAVAGTYFDEVHLNKRVGHFLRLTLGYFGSMHLASSHNTFNLRADAVRTGDVLVHRWQKSGIGHTLVVKDVADLGDGQLEASVVSGSMPRRQPKWESGIASKTSFTSAHAGGPGENGDGQAYASLGGGIKRFRVTKNIGGYWTNTWMAADEASWINDTDHDAIAARPGIFDVILGEADPNALRDALVAMVDDARHHLREYPASCAARERREDAFAKLYLHMEEHFDGSDETTDAQYRSLEDYVFQKLDYPKSKTCCWNSTTAAMYQIVMDYNHSLMQDQCVEPVVFKASSGGYQAFADYAAATGRGHLWKSWSEDEPCAQRDTSDDVTIDTATLSWCQIGDDADGGGCDDDGYEDNDVSAEAVALGLAGYGDLSICSGDDDYFRFEVSGGVSITIAFDHSAGDLDLSLIKDGVEVDSSTGTGDSETVSASGGGSYHVRVYGYQGAQGSYSLTASAL